MVLLVTCVMTVLKLFSIDVGGPCLSVVNRLDTMISVLANVDKVCTVFEQNLCD